MTVFVEDSFDSAHWLPNVSHDHKCNNLHGHTYRIRLEFSGDVNTSTGWVIDYDDIKSVWVSIKNLLDHKCLNYVISNPTSENIATFILVEIMRTHLYGMLSKIEIRETEHCGVVLEI